MNVRTEVRAEQIWLPPDKNLHRLCHIAKNLYNEANYIIRQEFFKTGKWTRYNEFGKLLKESDNYKILPAQTAQQILRVVDRNWKSFFRSIKEWKKFPDKFKGRPKLPRYKKKDGEFLLIFTNQQAKIRGGFLVLPEKVGLKIKTRIKEGLREVRIIPKGVGYVLEIVYHKMVEVIEKNKDRVAGVDLGVCNLITIANNIGRKPIVVKGGVVKSFNQFYNMKKAWLQGVYDKQGVKTGKKMKMLSAKRDRKLNDFFHKVSKWIVEWCKHNDIGRIVVGHNANWKQNVKLGKRNNQNFVQIPYSKLIHQIKYKAEEAGIEVVEVNESHTSKCSFLDNEPVEHRDQYIGKRISRGLFRSAKGMIINADVNAAYNIMRKAILKAFTRVKVDRIEGVGLHPMRWTGDSIAQSILGQVV